MTITINDLTGYTEYEIKQISEAIKSLSSGEDEDTTDEWTFEYPDYGGIPDQLAGRLTSDQVDHIQDALYGGTHPRDFDEVTVAKLLVSGA